MKKLLTLCIATAFVFQSCEYKNTKTTKDTTERTESIQASEEDNAKAWLIGIFECKDSDGYCYYLDAEESICSKRFIDFLADANEIYGPSNLTEEELPEAEKKYKEKWSAIYPLYSEEMWPFGRGNDDAANIKDVKIDKISDLKYSIFIDYDGEIKTQNEVTLIMEDGHYKIDYCKTEFVE